MKKNNLIFRTALLSLLIVVFMINGCGDSETPTSPRLPDDLDENPQVEDLSQYTYPNDVIYKGQHKVYRTPGIYTQRTVFYYTSSSSTIQWWKSWWSLPIYYVRIYWSSSPSGSWTLLKEGNINYWKSSFPLYLSQGVYKFVITSYENPVFGTPQTGDVNIYVY